jgi:hypothetical protein
MVHSLSEAAEAATFGGAPLRLALFGSPAMTPRTAGSRCASAPRAGCAWSSPPSIVLDLSLGDEVRAEVSCKFTFASIAESAAEGGLALSHRYGHPAELFALAVRRRGDP